MVVRVFPACSNAYVLTTPVLTSMSQIRPIITVVIKILELLDKSSRSKKKKKTTDWSHDKEIIMMAKQAH